MFVMFNFVFVFCHFVFMCSSVPDFKKGKINIKYLIEYNFIKNNNCVLRMIVIKYYFNKL